MNSASVCFLGSLGLVANLSFGCGNAGSSPNMPSGASGAASSGAAGSTGGSGTASGAGSGSVAASGSSGTGIGSGAAAGSGAQADASEPDGSRDAASSGGDTDATGGDGGVCPGLFCEDFEQGQLDPSKWDIPPPTLGAEAPTVQQKNVAHGRYAVQFHAVASPAAKDFAYILTKSLPSALQTHNFGRAYFFISPRPQSADMGLVFGGTLGFPKPTYLSIANHASGWQFGFIKLQGSPGGEVQAYASSPIPMMTWTCLEWEFNDQPDSINVWGGGVAIGSLNDQHVDYPGGHVPGAPLFNNMSSGLIGGFAQFGFGFYDWHASGRPAFDLYYDDIVLDTNRVGCLP
jgi:hypothetical protein